MGVECVLGGALMVLMGCPSTLKGSVGAEGAVRVGVGVLEGLESRQDGDSVRTQEGCAVCVGVGVLEGLKSRQDGDSVRTQEGVQYTMNFVNEGTRWEESGRRCPDSHID
jgi:hypothetical protein